MCYFAAYAKKLSIIIVIVGHLYRSMCKRTPTGGAKDSIPPVLVSANPSLNKVNFDSDKVVLVFDEYIQLKDIANQLIVSPPIEKSTYKTFRRKVSKSRNSF